MKLGALCVVEWQDILATCGWEKKDEVEPPRFWTVGYLVEKNKKVVKIANTTDEKKEFYAFHAFPIGCVVSIKEIKGNPA